MLAEAGDRRALARGMQASIRVAKAVIGGSAAWKCSRTAITLEHETRAKRACSALRAAQRKKARARPRNCPAGSSIAARRRLGSMAGAVRAR